METLLTERVQHLKDELMPEGFMIIGIFGSYARGEETAESDIDILYRLDTEKFLGLYPGFRAFGRLGDIQQLLSDILQKKVDIADIDALRESGKKYILKDVCYV